MNGLTLREGSDLLARSFICDGFAWIDLAGATPSADPDGGDGIILLAVDAVGLRSIVAEWVDLV